MSRLASAGQAQILSAALKDGAIIQDIQESITEMIRQITGNIRNKDQIIKLSQHATKLIYYICTTLAGYQTLGEEYAGIVLVNSSRYIPSKEVLLQMILLKCGVPVVSYIMKLWDAQLKSEAFSTTVEPEIQDELKKLYSFIKEMVFHLPTINSGMFYLNGSFYDIAMRLSGVHYVLIRIWQRNADAHPGFRLLGMMTLLYSVVLVYHSYKNWHHKNLDINDLHVSSTNVVDSNLKCCYCLEVRSNTSVTPCGHLFCWNCIMETLQNKPECPVCREVVHPSRVVFLKN